ncbi:hypothetical protein RFI_17510, partial [Reticulomyxa filosa]
KKSKGRQKQKERICSLNEIMLFFVTLIFVLISKTINYDFLLQQLFILFRQKNFSTKATYTILPLKEEKMKRFKLQTILINQTKNPKKLFFVLSFVKEHSAKTLYLFASVVFYGFGMGRHINIAKKVLANIVEHIEFFRLETIKNFFMFSLRGYFFFSFLQGNICTCCSYMRLYCITISKCNIRHTPEDDLREAFAETILSFNVNAFCVCCLFFSKKIINNELPDDHARGPD